MQLVPLRMNNGVSEDLAPLWDLSYDIKKVKLPPPDGEDLVLLFQDFNAAYRNRELYSGIDNLIQLYDWQAYLQRNKLYLGLKTEALNINSPRLYQVKMPGWLFRRDWYEFNDCDNDYFIKKPCKGLQGRSIKLLPARKLRKKKIMRKSANEFLDEIESSSKHVRRLKITSGVFNNYLIYHDGGHVFQEFIPTSIKDGDVFVPPHHIRVIYKFGHITASGIYYRSDVEGQHGRHGYSRTNAARGGNILPLTGRGAREFKPSELERTLLDAYGMVRPELPQALKDFVFDVSRKLNRDVAAYDCVTNIEDLLDGKSNPYYLLETNMNHGCKLFQYTRSCKPEQEHFKKTCRVLTTHLVMNRDAYLQNSVASTAAFLHYARDHLGCEGLDDKIKKLRRDFDFNELIGEED